MSESKAMIKKEDKAIEKTRAIKSATPYVDIYENEEEILIHAEMPGVKKEDVEIHIDNGTLSLSGVRRFEDKGAATWKEFADLEYTRRFSVPQSIDVEKVAAELKDGVLILHLPKSEAARPRQIEIRAA